VSYLAQCPRCGARATIGQGNDPDSAVTCGCCPQPHHHGQAANACPRGHEGQPCPVPDGGRGCPATPPGQPCPGGHCGLGVPGCTVCRPLVIVALPDTAALVASTLREG
jgi:hypothetical protein